MSAFAAASCVAKRPAVQSRCEVSPAANIPSAAKGAPTNPCWLRTMPALFNLQPKKYRPQLVPPGKFWKANDTPYQGINRRSRDKARAFFKAYTRRCLHRVFIFLSPLRGTGVALTKRLFDDGPRVQLDGPDVGEHGDWVDEDEVGWPESASAIARPPPGTAHESTNRSVPRERSRSSSRWRRQLTETADAFSISFIPSTIRRDTDSSRRR